MWVTESILYIYPNLTMEDFEVFDDGKWPYIKWHNKEIEQPTQEEIEIAWIEVQKLQQAEMIKKEKAEQIGQIASISDQLNLTAWTLDIVVDLLAETNPEILEHPWIIESKNKLNEIKNILNK